MIFPHRKKGSVQVDVYKKYTHKENTAQNMPVIHHNRTALPIVDKNIPAKDHMPDKNQKSPKFPAHEREEELIVYAKFRIDAQDYHTPPFLWLLREDTR